MKALTQKTQMETLKQTVMHKKNPKKVSSDSKAKAKAERSNA